MSHRFWVSRLGGGRDALDRSVRINNVAARIVGVAPPGFFGLRAGQWPDVYAPLAMKVAFQPRRSGGAPRGEDDRNWWVRQVGRLKPGSLGNGREEQRSTDCSGTCWFPTAPSKIPELDHLAGPPRLRCAEPEGYQSAVDSDAAGRRAAADRLRQRGESAAVALGRAGSASRPCVWRSVRRERGCSGST